MAADFETVRREAYEYASLVRRALPVDKAYLFGSYAKGTASELSDVDVAFFLREYGDESWFDLGVQALRLSRGFRSYFEPMVYPVSALAQGNPFISEIIKTGVEL